MSLADVTLCAKGYGLTELRSSGGGLPELP